MSSDRRSDISLRTNTVAPVRNDQTRTSKDYASPPVIPSPITINQNSVVTDNELQQQRQVSFHKQERLQQQTKQK